MHLLSSDLPSLYDIWIWVCIARGVKIFLLKNYLWVNKIDYIKFSLFFDIVSFNFSLSKMELFWKWNANDFKNIYVFNLIW